MYYQFNNTYNNKEFRFIPFWGILKSKLNDSPISNQCELIGVPQSKALNISAMVKDPYKLKIPTIHIPQIKRISFGEKIYAKILLFLYRYCYPLLWIISFLRLNIYEDSRYAIRVFHDIFPENQNTLCLPRSIFAATTSRRFHKNGAMFIGVFHPSRHMHAWIIEDEQNPCPFDTMWLHFSPVSIMI